MPNMSFFLTQKAFEDYEKDVTRRKGWKNLKPGQYFTAVKKSQGRKKGESIQVLGQCQCVSNKPEPLDAIIKHPIRDDQQWYRVSKDLQDFEKIQTPEVAREGFPEMTPIQFVQMFTKEMKCLSVSPVQRIVFKRLD